MRPSPSLLASACLLLAAGACAQAGDFKPDGDGYIRNWLVMEPFDLGDNASDHSEGSQKPFFTQEFFPGLFKATPKAGDKTKIAGKGEFTWRACQSDESVYKFEAKDNAMYLAIAYVTSQREIPGAVLSIGSDDSSCWRVNGTELLSVYAGRAVEVDADKTRPFTLNKGTNVIFAEVINGNGETGLSARILDKEGKAVKDVVISLTPPDANK